MTGMDETYFKFKQVLGAHFARGQESFQALDKEVSHSDCHDRHMCLLDHSDRLLPYHLDTFLLLALFVLPRWVALGR